MTFTGGHRRGATAAAAAGRAGERGGTQLKFLLVLALIGAALYVGAQYVPMAYRARVFESFMQDTVNNAAMMDKNAAWVEQQLRRGFEDYGVPDDASVTVGVNDTRMEASVQYAHTVSLVFTEYEYDFDKTVRSSTVVTRGSK